MAPPPRIVNWLKATYARPQINLEWLEECCNYIIGDMDVNPEDFKTLQSHVEEQLLQSSLSDSFVPNTGLPASDSHDIRIKNTLCEITAITEIGHSAFTLKNVRQARVDKEDLAGLAGDLDDGEDYSIPKYPRSMLRFEISDGSKTMRAIEYRRIPELELGVTPLGTKVYIKDVNVRRGIVFLEPNGIQIKGFKTEELEENQEKDFVRGLRLRMRLPEEDPNDQQQPDARQQREPPNVSNAVAPVNPHPQPALHAAKAVSNPTGVQRAVNPNPAPAPANRPQAPTIVSNAPVVDLEPEDLELDIEDSYSIGDGNFFEEDEVFGGDTEENGEVDESFEIDDAFLQDLEEAEQRALVGLDGTVIDLDEESQVEILPQPRSSKPVKVEEVIDISD